MKQMRSAFRVLLWLGIIHAVIGAGLTALGLSDAAPSNGETAFDPSVFVVIGIGGLVIGVIFFALAFWARRNPLPAAITGLVLYVSLNAIDVVMALGSDQPEGAFRGIIIKVIIIGFLAKAVSAGIKFRALKREPELAAA